MQKLEKLYEGKAKMVFRTDDPELLIVEYKDDATAFNGEKRGHRRKRRHQQPGDQPPDDAAGGAGRAHPLRAGAF